MFKKVLLTVGLFFVLPLVSLAEGMPGARSATNESGDVFLGGNYIEVGVSKNGSFGTSTSAPVSFGSHTRYSGTGPLGLISDGDGWDNGNDPTSGDFFLPGTPEERWAIAYKIDGVSYQVHAADRMVNYSSGFSNYTNLFETVDQSDVSNNILKAYVSGVTNENVKVELTYSFDVNDKYYNTEVKITNLGDKPITDVRFLRSFDPDQDSWMGGGAQTYNKVICNPDSSKEGGEDNFAMVVGRGGTSLDGFFFVSFDNRARVSRGVAFEATNVYDGGFWVDKTEGLPTYATEESIEMTKEKTNGYTLEDLAVSIEFKLDTIDAGKNTELNYYSSLDPNVLSSINNILKAVAAKVKNLSDTRIEVETKEGYEYSIDGGKNWQDSGVFEGLEPGKEYTVLSRIKATGTEEASEPEETSVTTKNSSKDTPDVFETIVTEEEVIIESNPNYEYSIDGGKNWQNSPVFTGLKPDTVYTILARYKETSTDMPGNPTNPIVIHTPAKIETALDEATNVSVDIIVEENAPGITIHKGLLYEAIMDDEELKEIVNSGHDAKIVFDVKTIELKEEDLNEVKNYINDNEIAFSIDATLKLYQDGVFKKDITTSGKKITFTFRVPKEYVKKGRKFSIVRKHVKEDDTIEYEVLIDEDNNDETITVSSDKFSDFTVIYKDVINNPKTGDNILIFVGIVIVCVIVLVILKRKKD